MKFTNEIKELSLLVRDLHVESLPSSARALVNSMDRILIDIKNDLDIKEALEADIEDLERILKHTSLCEEEIIDMNNTLRDYTNSLEELLI